MFQHCPERTAMTQTPFLSRSIRTMLFLALAAGAVTGAHAADGAVSLTGAASDSHVSLTGAPSAPASQAAPLSADESKLVGAWLEGLTPAVRERLASLPPERAAAMGQMLGDTLVFRADHTMTIYPRCAQRASFGKSGALGLGAQWRIEGTKLRVTAEREGKPLDRLTPFKLDGDQLFFFENMAARPQVMGRYDGPLPPHCD
jgi:hypothetical protein